MAETLANIISSAFDGMAGALRVCMPGRIEKYDNETHLATVQPLLKIRYYGREKAKLLPSINRVPIVHPRTDNAIIKLPISKGSIVTLIFADRSLENWLLGNGDPKETFDKRKHHINDAYAIPGGYPEKNKFTTQNNDALELQVKAGTKIAIGNGAEELLQLAHDAFTSLKDLTSELSQTLSDIQLITHTDPQGGVTGVPINASSFATIKSSVDSIGSAVDATISSLEEIKV